MISGPSLPFDKRCGINLIGKQAICILQILYSLDPNQRTFCGKEAEKEAPYSPRSVGLLRAPPLSSFPGHVQYRMRQKRKAKNDKNSDNTKKNFGEKIKKGRKEI
jgi:hypothetical protein